MGRDRIPIGEAAEDYLKAIYKLQVVGGPVATSALAGQLGVTEPTATAMIKRLARLGLVRHTPYHGVVLTTSGEKVALEIIRHHRLLELFLVQALGLGWDQVHKEAERLEHLVSDEVESRIDEVLGHPTTDPHGDPIPTRDGWLDHVEDRSLVDLEPGERATVGRVPDDESDLLQYLAQIGLVPKASVEIVDKVPFGGPLILQLGGMRHAIGRELAGTIRVSRPVDRE